MSYRIASERAASHSYEPHENIAITLSMGYCMLTIENLPLEEGQSSAVDLGDGVTAIITCVGYHGKVPIYTLSVDGAALFTGTSESVLAQAASYRQSRTIRPGPRYKLEEHVVPTPFGDRTDTEWVVVYE